MKILQALVSEREYTGSLSIFCYNGVYLYHAWSTIVGPLKQLNTVSLVVHQPIHWLRFSRNPFPFLFLSKVNQDRNFVIIHDYINASHQNTLEVINPLHPKCSKQFQTIPKLQIWYFLVITEMQLHQPVMERFIIHFSSNRHEKTANSLN